MKKPALENQKRRLRFQRAMRWALVFAVVSASASETQPDSAPSSARQSIGEKLAEISADRTPAQVRAHIAAWKRRDSHSVEPYLVSALYEQSLSRQPTRLYDFETPPGVIIPPRPGANEVLIVDKTGQQVGIMGEIPTGPKPDAETVRRQLLRAAAELEQAEKKFPNRLDLMIDRAIVLSEARAWKSLRSQMESALQRAATEPEKFRWLEDQKPPRPPAEFLLNGLQVVITTALDEHDQGGGDRARQFATLGLKYFPSHVPLLSDMGSSYGLANEWKRALPYYERARNLAPEDSIVLCDLAQAYLQLGRDDEARRAAEDTLRLNGDPKIVASAKDTLQKLDDRIPMKRP